MTEKHLNVTWQQISNRERWVECEGVGGEGRRGGGGLDGEILSLDIHTEPERGNWNMSQNRVHVHVSTTRYTLYA